MSYQLPTPSMDKASLHLKVQRSALFCVIRITLGCHNDFCMVATIDIFITD